MPEIFIMRQQIHIEIVLSAAIYRLPFLYTLFFLLLVGYKTGKVGWGLAIATKDGSYFCIK